MRGACDIRCITPRAQTLPTANLESDDVNTHVSTKPGYEMRAAIFLSYIYCPKATF